MGFLRLASIAAAAALALAACAEGKTGSDAGAGAIDAAGPPPDARPGRPDAIPGSEICDGMDNDGDTFIDEGSDLCDGADNVTESRCNGLLGCEIDGCADGFADFDGEFDNGCECGQDALETEVDDCANARDVGDVPDTNAAVEVIANSAPEGDEDWYRFRAVDTPDTTCDAFHVRVQFLENPDDQFIIDVWRGGCGAEQLCDAGNDMQWYTNYFASPTGECPCGPTAANHCDDDTAEYHVRVRRKAGVAPSCANYRLEISNGAYPAP